MKEKFCNKLRLNKANQERLETINKIIDEYRRQGYKMTLRQTFYQLVSRDIIPNQQKEYAKLSDLLVKGRMAGCVDWDAIEDRLRRPKISYSVTGIKNAIEDTIEQYKLDRMDGQCNYIEVSCEKDALSNVLFRVTDKYHIPLNVNRGYSSCTAMHDAYQRFGRAQRAGKNLVLLYLGDHDASGQDMIRDIKDRLIEFGIELTELIPVALTSEQIEQYNPPPNPAKMTDPRADKYVAEHGDMSWEVDALPPDVLHRLLEEAITSRIDIDLYNGMLEQEEEDKQKLMEFRDKYEED